MEVVFYNGEFLTKSDVSLSISSRAFNFGDGFFETIKIINSNPFNFSLHIERIKRSLNILKINNNYSSEFLQEKILHLIKVNHVVEGAVKVHVSRSGSGKYLPLSNNCDILIDTNEGDGYQHNDKISLCYYEQQCKANKSLSNIKSINSLVSVLASIYAKEHDFGSAILFNTSGNVIETANANIFIVKGDSVYTPPLADGCVDGTMRKWVSNELDVIEETIFKNDILDADEVFITNATSGIIGVEYIEDKYFTCFKTTNIMQQQLVSLNLDL